WSGAHRPSAQSPWLRSAACSKKLRCTFSCDPPNPFSCVVLLVGSVPAFFFRNRGAICENKCDLRHFEPSVRRPVYDSESVPTASSMLDIIHNHWRDSDLSFRDLVDVALCYFSICFE